MSDILLIPGLNLVYAKMSVLAATTTGNGASQIGIEDAGGYFTGTTVEAALQELGSNTITTVVGSGAIPATAEFILCNSASAIALTLPSVLGKELTIKNINTGVVTVTGTIDGETSQTINQWECMKIKCYATDTWGII